MLTSEFWKQTLERVLGGAGAGGLGGIASLAVTDQQSWIALGGAVVVGALTALFASLAGSRVGDPNSPLATVKAAEPEREDY